MLVSPSTQNSELQTPQPCAALLPHQQGLRQCPQANALRVRQLLLGKLGGGFTQKASCLQNAPRAPCVTQGGSQRAAVCCKKSGSSLLPQGKRREQQGLSLRVQCRAVRCDPRPSMMTDLSIQTANSGKVSYTAVEEMERALAAGERQALLQPDDGWVSSGLLGLGEWVAGCVWGLVWLGGGCAALMLGAGPWMGCTSSTEVEVTPFRPCSQQQCWLAAVQCWSAQQNG